MENRPRGDFEGLPPLTNDTVKPGEDFDGLKSQADPFAPSGETLKTGEMFADNPAGQEMKKRYEAALEELSVADISPERMKEMIAEAKRRVKAGRNPENN